MRYDESGFSFIVVRITVFLPPFDKKKETAKQPLLPFGDPATIVSFTP